jgi:predicted  nucleic acid-binding Zn-ribbon protein
MDETEKKVDQLSDEIVGKLREIARIKGKIEAELDNKSGDIKILERKMLALDDQLALIGAMAKHILVEYDSDLLSDAENLEPDRHEIETMNGLW